LKIHLKSFVSVIGLEDAALVARATPAAAIDGGLIARGGLTARGGGGDAFRLRGPLAIDVRLPRGGGGTAALHLALSVARGGGGLRTLAAADCDAGSLIAALERRETKDLDLDLRLDGVRKGSLKAKFRRAGVAPPRAP